MDLNIWFNFEMRGLHLEVQLGIDATLLLNIESFSFSLFLQSLFVSKKLPCILISSLALLKRKGTTDVFTASVDLVSSSLSASG